jgi:peptide/nickel transport system permease protein
MIPQFIAKRLLALIPLLLGLSLLAFVLGMIAPGDPAYFVLANDSQGEPTQQELMLVREQLGLNDPFFVRYLRWVVSAMHGDLGKSYRSGKPVLEELKARLPVSLSVSVPALAFTVALGIPLGILAAGERGRGADRFSQAVAVFLISVPGFWLGILFIFIFAELLRWMPTSGFGSIRQMIMPSFVLASGTIGMTIRLTRSSVLDELGKDYILTGYSTGIARYYLLWRNALPNAAIPILTLLGSYLGNIIGGSVIVETLFALPGMGEYAVSAVLNRDFPAVQGYVMVTGTVFICIHLVLDLSYLFIDPRIRIPGGTSG